MIADNNNIIFQGDDVSYKLMLQDDMTLVESVYINMMGVMGATTSYDWRAFIERYGLERHFKTI